MPQAAFTAATISQPQCHADTHEYARGASARSWPGARASSFEPGGVLVTDRSTHLPSPTSPGSIVFQQVTRRQMCFTASWGLSTCEVRSAIASSTYSVVMPGSFASGIHDFRLTESRTVLRRRSRI